MLDWVQDYLSPSFLLRSATFCRHVVDCDKHIKNKVSFHAFFCELNKITFIGTHRDLLIAYKNFTMAYYTHWHSGDKLNQKQIC